MIIAFNQQGAESNWPCRFTSKNLLPGHIPHESPWRCIVGGLSFPYNEWRAEIVRSWTTEELLSSRAAHLPFSQVLAAALEFQP